MKQTLAILIMLFPLTQLWSQEMDNTRIPVIGEKAPAFIAKTTDGIINFPSDFGSSWKILFSHPQDFTPVCSSELLELAYMQDEFRKMNVKLLVISSDSLRTHFDWKRAMEELNYKGRGQVNIKFPLADDNKYIISKKYGMIHAASSSTKDIRAVFIIDPENFVQAILFYPMNIGRNMDEIKRAVQALQIAQSEKVDTPANWQSGNDVLISIPPGTDYQNPKTLPEDYYSVAWFMLFRKAYPTSSIGTD